MKTTTIRFCYVGGQYSDFSNINEEELNKIIEFLNDEKHYIIINNQWINKRNVITLVQLPPAVENTEEIVQDEEIVFANDPEN